MLFFFFTFEDPCSPSSLHFTDRHDGSQWLHQSNDSQRGALQVRWKHVLVQRCVVISHWNHIRGQKRKGKLVTCCKHLQDTKRGCQSLSQGCHFLCTKRQLNPPQGQHRPLRFRHQTRQRSHEICGCWVLLELFRTGCGWEDHR